MLESGQDPGSKQQDTRSNKLTFIRFFFALGAGGALLASYIDHLEGYNFVSMVEAIIGVLGLVFLFISRRHAVHDLTIKVTLVLVYVMYAVASFTQMDSMISLVWVPAYPIVFFFLTRHQTGLVWSALTLVTFIIAYLTHPLFADTPRIPLEAFLQSCAAFVFVGSLAFFYEVARSRQEHRLLMQADYDYLTGVYNRRGLTHAMEAEINRVERYGTRLSFLLMDLDDFKSVNDRYGHRNGDLVLKDICNITRNSIRQSDILARWGGEEFAVLMPEAGLEQAAQLADKLRSIIAAHLFRAEVRITVSIGVAQYQLPEAEDEMLQRADAALYRAKAAGKNRVEKGPATPP